MQSQTETRVRYPGIPLYAMRDPVSVPTAGGLGSRQARG